MTISFKGLVEKYKFTENKVLSILKAAQVVNSKDTIDKVREREFSDESIENGFKVILDYFETVVPQDDFVKAEELFKKHQSEKAKVGKQAVVADAKSQAASTQEKGAITAKNSRSVSALAGTDGKLIPEILIDGATADLWIEYRDEKAADLATAISEAPFKAMDEAADEIHPDAVGRSWRGSFLGQVSEELNNPNLVQLLRDKYFGKKRQG
jgi:hypothetical protein